MIDVWVYTIVSVIAISLVSFVGALTFALNTQKLRKVLLFLVSFSAGALLADALVHLIPQAAEGGFNISVSVSILAGILAFFILEKFIQWRHCHIPTSRSHPHPLAYMNLVGDIFHNFLDGVVIAGSYLVSFPLGLTTTIAVFLHEIPQEMGDFGVLLYAGMSKAKALLSNFLVALTAVLGAVVSLIIGSYSNSYSAFVIPFTAGGFLYIAGSDLIPEMHKECSVRISFLQLSGLLIGIGIMLLFVLFE